MTHPRPRSILALASPLTLVLVACSSGGGSGPPDGGGVGSASVLVGEVDGGQALIALVRGEGTVMAYTCGIDAALPTHTGWFFGQMAGDAAALPRMVSAAGLALTGTFEGGGARGTLALADGSTVAWTAEPARGPAGLYHHQDSVALTGLIVANDGRTAGSARLATTTTSVPVTTTTTTTTTTSTADGGTGNDGGTGSDGGTTSTTGLTVKFPATTTDIRLVTTQPVLTADAVTVSVPSPTVVFLVHGMSDSFNTPGTAAPEDPVKCEGPRDTPFYSRCEWGIDFIPGLFGNDAARAPALFNLAGQDVSGMRYLTDPANRPLIDEQLGITARDASGCVQDPTAVERYDPRAALHFVTVPAPTPGVPPPLSVFVTWRDSTRGLVESGLRITRQAYAALRWFEREYRKSPKVVFVSQSFGGLVSRFLLSNPPDAAIAASPAGVDRLVVCPEDRAKMDYLRDRTVFLLTLATPHEGSYMAEWGEPAKAALRGALADVERGLQAAGETDFGRALRAVDQGVARAVGAPPGLLDRARAEIPRLQNLLTTPALRDLRLETMRAVNLGLLSPERARRTAASPIAGAQGQLVPVYATLGRSPGSDAFDSPDVLGGFARYGRKREKVKGWIFSTMFLSDLLVKQFFPDGFGRVDVAPYAPHAAVLDRRARLFDLSPQTRAAEQFLEQAASGVLGNLAAYFTGRFGGGAAGVAAYLEQVNLQVALPRAMVPIHLDRRWELALTGTVEVPMPAFACGGQSILLDYDVLVRALFASFGDTSAVLAAVSGRSLDEVVVAAGGVIEEGAELAAGAAAWLVGKAAQLAAVPEPCRLPASPGDALVRFYQLANLINWRVVAATGTVPAPAWRRTGTPLSDGEMDTDGVVHAASALGLTLGREPFFFGHDRRGSWYRLHDNPVVEKYNHGMQYQNDVGQWIARTLLVPSVGPVPQPDRFSAWP